MIEGLLPEEEDGVSYDELERQAKMTEGPK